MIRKHISHECKCKFNGRKCIQIKSGITINVSVSAKTKKTKCMQKNMFRILLHVVAKMVDI